MKSTRTRYLSIFSLLIFLLCINVAFGQTEFSLYSLHKTLPQSNMLNPAFAPNFKLVIGLPVISSVSVRADFDGISFEDVFNSSGGESLVLDTALISSRMKEVNRVRLNQSIQLFYLGMTLGKSYVSIGLHEVSELKMNYPGDLVGWAIRGPGHSQYVGRPLDFGSLYGKALAYNKTSISLGRSFGDRLRLGARFNYLRGLAMLETTKLSGKLIVGIDSVTVQTGPIQVNTSGVDFFSARRNAGDYVNYFFNNENNGTAWDFGASYQITRRLSVSAAINNIGAIHWKDYTRSYHHKPVTYTYRGSDYLEFINSSGKVNVDDEVDSLANLFKPTESTGRKYSTPLTGKVYTGINYRVRGMSNLSALLYFDLLRGERNPAVSLGYSAQLGRGVNASIGVTLQQRKIDNIGVGLALRLANFQVFATSDRAQSILNPARASRGDIHTGLNLVFGKLDEEPLESDEYHEPGVKKGKPLEKKRAYAATSSKINKRYTSKEKPGAGARAVNKGNYRDDMSHIVVVATFISRDKAERYSRELRQRGFTNKIGYESETSLYRVYVFRSRDRHEARHMRNAFKANGEFQLRRVLILSIADSKFE